MRRPRRFADPRWPIALSYPEGWRLDVSTNELMLRSPDARDMLFDNELSCVRGGGLPKRPGPGEPPIEVRWPFFLTRFGWRANTSLSDGCEGDDCVTPTIRTTSAGSIILTEIGYRSSGPWGYMGQADARVYLFVVGDAWTWCKDRVLDTEGRLAIASGSLRREE